LVIDIGNILYNDTFRIILANNKNNMRQG